MKYVFSERQKSILDFFKTVAIALAIILPIRYFIAQPFYVQGASMEPNFHNYEYLFIEEVSYYFHAPERGDVVVIKNPQDNSEYFIKRIIGLPNETVHIQQHKVLVNDVAIDESLYLPEDIETWGNVNVTLSDDEYFVMGDNRGNSMDSRMFGPIHKKAIVGRTWIRVFPFSRMTHFTSVEYPST